ncbi:hypothetical protein [Ectobacillus ponti]|uniref:Uncharacterized protein n=1 Tax=Ectobacillus ponti TaxID=2961894 RepID=A0AA41X632_9BACI|nr:hypothetical protein [Ectobacillus ponti]MCP8969467.1 hypothetical protein [Ectobacillus ponti]
MKEKKDKKEKKRRKGWKLLLLLPVLAIILFGGARALHLGGYPQVQQVQNFFGQYDAKQALQSAWQQGKNTAQAAFGQHSNQQNGTGKQSNTQQVFGGQNTQQQSNQQAAVQNPQNQQTFAANQQGGQQALNQQFGKHERGSRRAGMMKQGKDGFQRDGFHGGKMGHGKHGGFAQYLLAAGALILGWFLRRGAGETAWKKWTGWALMAIGLGMLLSAAVVPVIMIAAVGYWLYTRRKAPSQDWVEAPALQEMYAETSNAAKLDEWERNIRKEEK